MNENSEDWQAIEPVPEDGGDAEYAIQWAVRCNKQRRKVCMMLLIQAL